MTYRSLVERWAPTVLRGYYGQRFNGVMGLLFDMAAQAVSDAVQGAWIGVGDGPAPDALGIIAREISLPRYPSETWDQHYARLQRAWDDWPTAGDEASIIGQLAAAGFPGAIIKTPQNWPTKDPVPHWSQFWVLFRAGTHAVTGPGPIVGGGAIPLVGSFAVGDGTYLGTGASWVIGDGTVIGPDGLAPLSLLTMRRIIRKFKPAHWVCRLIMFEVSGWMVGDDSVVGEPGLVIGGSVVASVGA